MEPEEKSIQLPPDHAGSIGQVLKLSEDIIALLESNEIAGMEKLSIERESLVRQIGEAISGSKEAEIVLIALAEDTSRLMAIAQQHLGGVLSSSSDNQTGKRALAAYNSTATNPT